MKKILITGAAGFIGSNFLKNICVREDVVSNYSFHIIDALTYAGNFISIEKEVENFNHISFEQMNICDNKKVASLESMDFDGIIHFAAESHVDRSIDSPNVFLETNVLGTLNLLNLALNLYNKKGDFIFLQIGTDEVYGSLGLYEDAFSETTPVNPNSPYSSSKASADLLVNSYYKTFGLPVVITRCSNNYGPYQFPEKLIPLMIKNALNDTKLPVYGEGKNIRDWIHVDDHNLGVWAAFTMGKPGEIYNLGGNSELQNIDVVKKILKHTGRDESLIEFVTDRLGHDFRYAIDFEKSKRELGWSPQKKFEDGLHQTIEWYKSNQEWIANVLEKKK